MKHSFTIKQIAAQAGLSIATVDRVLNNRGSFRADTKRDVYNALADLESRQSSTLAAGRPYLIDIILQRTPEHVAIIRKAFREQLPSLAPSAIRGRFHVLDEKANAAAVAGVLQRISSRRPDGVIIDAAADPAISEALALLEKGGASIVSLSRPQNTEKGVSMVGCDLEAAGATAAYLLRGFLGDSPGDVLICGTVNDRGEEDGRAQEFCLAMRAAQPRRRLIRIDCHIDDDAHWRDEVSKVLEGTPSIDAIYSIAGRNGAIIEAFRRCQRKYRAFISHDLDKKNRALLINRKITVILEYDIGFDIRQACRIILKSSTHHSGRMEAETSNIKVITPFNLPQRD